MIRLTIATILPTKLRWLILLAFPLAYLMSAPESALYFAASFFACAWLIYHVDSFREDTIPVWLVLFLFILFYYFRYPILVSSPELFANISPHSVKVLYLHGDRSGSLVALKLSSFLFCIFCIVAGLLYGRRNCVQGKTEYDPLPSPACKRVKIGYLATLAILFLMLILGFVAYVYRIGQMGVSPGEPLPFRLKGIIYYARHVVIPLLILAVIYQASRMENRRLIGLGWVLLALHGVSDTLLRGSRSSILLCALLVVFLCVSGGVKIRRKEILVLAGIAGVAIFLFPIVTYYRILQCQTSSGVLENIVYAFNYVNKDVGVVLKSGIYSIYTRIPGLETAWAVSGLMDYPLGPRLTEIIRTPFGVTGYLNFNIYKVSVEAYTLFAPGFVGWFYLAGGWAGLAAGGVALALLCVWLPRWIYRGRMLWSPLANTFFLWVLFITLTDGTLDSNFLLIATGLATLAALEFFDRAIKPSARA